MIVLERQSLSFSYAHRVRGKGGSGKPPSPRRSAAISPPRVAGWWRWTTHEPAARRGARLRRRAAAGAGRRPRLAQGTPARHQPPAPARRRDDQDDAADVEWLHGQVGGALLGRLTASAWLRAAERGAPAPFAELEADNRAVLADVRAALDGRERDWAAYHRTTVAMHRANAAAWAGVDRIAQIDPDFVPD
jgi:hypothetical protein